MREIEAVKLSYIESGDRLRALNANAVATLQESMSASGLRTPITVRYFPDRPNPVTGLEDSYVLVAGAHRLAAARNLGWQEIECFIADDNDEDSARLWEIAENLHRAELTVLERSEHIAEWVRLADKLSFQVETKGPLGHRPEGGVNKAARELNLGKAEAHRAVKVAAISSDAKEAAREVGLDDNQSRLLEVSRAPLDQQAAVVREIVEARKRPSIDDDIKDRAARSVAEWIVEHANGNDLDALKANLFACGAKSVAVELTNLLGESIMDRRFSS